MHSILIFNIINMVINMDMIEKKLSGEIIYDGKIIKVEKHTVLCPNKNTSTREVVRHKGGSTILYINENDEVLLIRQYRYAYNEVIYELPAGKLEALEDPYDSAIRELEEEAGLKASRLDYLGCIYPTCGYSDEVIHLYLAKDVIKTHTNFDSDEFIESYYIPLNDVKKMIISGEIKDAKTICAISRYLMLNEK